MCLVVHECSVVHVDTEYIVGMHKREAQASTPSLPETSHAHGTY